MRGGGKFGFALACGLVVACPSVPTRDREKTLEIRQLQMLDFENFPNMTSNLCSMSGKTFLFFWQIRVFLVVCVAAKIPQTVPPPPPPGSVRVAAALRRGRKRETNKTSKGPKKTSQQNKKEISKNKRATPHSLLPRKSPAKTVKMLQLFLSMNAKYFVPPI